MASVVVNVPTILASRFAGKREITASAPNLRELINLLSKTYGDEVTETLLKPDGTIKHVINIYLNGKNINFLGGLDTTFKDGDKIYIMPAIAGG
jgi:adenylyltransferase/sulfurtransferase